MSQEVRVLTGHSQHLGGSSCYNSTTSSGKGQVKMDAISDFFGNIADWMNDNLDGYGVYAALATVVICTIVGIATL